MDSIFVRHTQTRWQRSICVGAYLMLAIGAIVLVLAQINNNHAKELLGALFSRETTSDEAAFYLLFALVAGGFFAFYLCLHDQVVRGDRIILTDDEISHFPKYPVFSFLTALRDSAVEVRNHRWSIRKPEIRRIVMSGRGILDSDMLVIEHNGGREYLTPSDWRWLSPNGRGGAKLPASPEYKTEASRVHNSPLIREMVRRGYAIEFQ